MTGAWNPHYAGLTAPMRYGDQESYSLVAEFVNGHGTVEDWGCGGGWLRHLIEPGPYRGIDGSCTPYADEIVDLTTYTSDVECVVLRHVLEHSYEWAQILDNACASFRSRLCIVLFTPPAVETHVLLTEPDYGDVPVIAFKAADLLARIPDDVRVDIEAIAGSYYGVETILKAVRDEHDDVHL